MTDKSICFVIHSLQVGGMERVMSEIVNYFVKTKKHQVHLILYGIKREIFYEVNETVIIHKPKFEFDNSKRLLSTLKTVRFLRNTIKEIDPISVLSFGERWNNLVLLSLLGTPIPIYVSDRAQPDKPLGFKDDFLRRKLYPRAKGIIAQTSQAKSFYESFLANHPKIRVIGNPINQQAIVNTPREKIVLTVGRLIETKHHDELIKLFVKINKLDWKLIIVGGDALNQDNKQKLEELVKSLNAQDRIILTGSQQDVASYYKRSAVFAFTSSSEGFPNVVGEALSFGLPVVSFDCIAGPSDMIQEGENGYLIELFDYKEFTSKLSLLMEDAVLREKMSSFAPTSILKFDKNQIGQEYFEFITQSS